MHNPSPLLDTGVLYREDNLIQLARFPDECIDLVYLDPPFFSNRVYEVIWGDEAEVRSFEDRWAGGIQNYIEWMQERVVHLHRVLRPDGSLYFHCDPHASHYLKVMLDEVFGFRNCQNEIVWKRFSSKNDPNRYGRSHDVILFYTKGPKFTWNTQYGPFEEDYVDTNYRYTEEETRRRYRLSDLTANKPGGDTDYEWHGMTPYRGRHWAYSRENMDQFLAEGRIVFRRTGMPVYKRYLDEMPGVPLQDVWTDIRLHAGSNERLGYPTQKPRELLERMIVASSNIGDVVLDPFCGCGTTIEAAHRLNRQWIGIDISTTAMEIMRRRLLKVGCVPTIENTPSSIPALKELKPFEFQNWIVNAVNGTQSAKKVGDMGIDGYWFFTKEPIQVKQSEHVGRNVVDNFETALRRAGETAGYIVAFSFTRDAVEETARAKHDGFNIRLVKVSEILLLVRGALDFSKKIGPQPATIDELPLPLVRKPNEKPTAEELVESDRRVG
jgi:DNA modification methylase